MAKVYYIFDDDEDDDDKYGYFPDKFRIYKETELSCVQDDKTFYELHLWVFWSRYDNISKLPPLSICKLPLSLSLSLHGCDCVSNSLPLVRFDICL
ncbi:hypothetical protein CsSME_00033983 [Camellia sinensis var. sinensis]